VSGKQRLSASVDQELVVAAHAAVAAGRAESVSAWVKRRCTDSLSTSSDCPRWRLAAYEAEHGEITEDEMRAAARRAESRAVVVRGGHTKAGGLRSRSQ